MRKESKRGKNPKSLANLKPIKPGEIRNPLGISRKRPYTERLEHLSELPLSGTQEGRKIMIDLKLTEGATWADAAMFEITRRAARGDLAAIREIIDRIEGKPKPVETEDRTSKEAHVYLVVGEEKVLDQAKPIAGSVEITGAVNVETATHHRPKRRKS